MNTVVDAVSKEYEGFKESRTIIFEPLYPGVEAPKRATAGSAGYDLKAHLDRDEILVKRREDEEPKREKTLISQDTAIPHVTLRPGDKAIIPLGFKARLPEGYEAQIRPRSGMSFKTGLDIPNSPGTIDGDYPEEWGVIVKNASGHDLTITHGERIAQMVLARYEVLDFTEGTVEQTTERVGGIGSTGRT